MAVSALLPLSSNLTFESHGSTQAVANYDGDGNVDAALSLGYGAGGLMEIRNGNGDGTFQPLTYYLKPAPLSSIASGAIVSGDCMVRAK